MRLSRWNPCAAVSLNTVRVCVLQPWRELFSWLQGLECPSVYFRTVNNSYLTVPDVISLFYWHPEPYSGLLVKSLLTCQKCWNNVNTLCLLSWQRSSALLSKTRHWTIWAKTFRFRKCYHCSRVFLHSFISCFG